MSYVIMADAGRSAGSCGKEVSVVIGAVWVSCCGCAAALLFDGSVSLMAGLCSSCCICTV